MSSTIDLIFGFFLNTLLLIISFYMNPFPHVLPPTIHPIFCLDCNLWFGLYFYKYDLLLPKCPTTIQGGLRDVNEFSLGSAMYLEMCKTPIFLTRGNNAFRMIGIMDELTILNRCLSHHF